MKDGKEPSLPFWALVEVFIELGSLFVFVTVEVAWLLAYATYTTTNAVYVNRMDILRDMILVTAAIVARYGFYLLTGW
jgi:hypothetical protein